jgi:dTDP-4-dehydrorhamnose reductase
MKILVTGATGMLGHKLVQRLSEKCEVYATIRCDFKEVENFGIFDRTRTIDRIDLCDGDSVSRVIELVNPEVVINAAGIVKQVPSSQDVIKTLTINSILPHRLKELSDIHGFKLVVVSTDCVFKGDKGHYRETDVPDAIDLYGRSKNMGEVIGERTLTLRTSIIGRELASKHGLVEWFLSNRGGRVSGFSRAIYSGFPTIVFADIIYYLLSKYPKLTGLYHLSSDPIDKFRLLSLINESYRANIEIHPDYEFVIDRSLDSTTLRSIVNFRPKPWAEMIDQMASDPTPYECLHNDPT